MEQTTSKTSKGIATFDLETTGLDIVKDRIIQIAVVRKDNDGKIEEKKVLINPEIPIAPEATEVHGITNEMVKDAPTFKQVARSLYKYIEGYDLSGYNILRFDLPLLVEELLRAGVDFSFDGVKIIDVMKIYKKLHPRDLGSCYNYYTGRTLDGAHDALNDTRATAEILDAMTKEEGELEGKTMDELDEMSNDNKSIVDFAGKFTRNDAGVICFNFGKHKGTPCANELGFIDWMIGKDFTQDTLNWAKKIKNGEAI